MSQIPPGLAGVIHDGPPVKPRPAATVLLLRGTEPWEVLMLRRPGGADFAPGANVFPGGSVHADDRLLGDPLRGAAVRELFEELGILLARSRRGFATEAEAERIRLRITHGVSFPTALKESHLEPAVDELFYFSRWVTPEQLRRRFDTRFYLARLPRGQEVHPQPGEVEAWSWVTAAEALGKADFTMVFATRRVLEMAAVDLTADALLERHRNRRRVPVIRPVVRITDGRFEVVTETLPAIPRARGRPAG
ncbi:MAG: NUDIX hydrolase [Candidatus Dormibacteraeota bacterium]|nr:NUDIX hydrolase [Candidatus Dormibacteraeota bacterium]